jgi:acetyl esterase/lipase
MRWIIASIVVVAASATVFAAEPMEIPLWDKGPPGFESRKDDPEKKEVRESGEYKVTNVHNPTLTAFLPAKEKANGVGVVLCPGGGFRELWMMHEGINEAKWLNERGIAAFVLKYRLPREKDSPYKLEEQPLQDGQRAMRLVRSKAKEWGVDPNRLGMMGFSAGGEVVATTCNGVGKGKDDAADPIDRENARPDFQALIYSGPLGIKGANVTKEMPPTFMLVGDNDNAATWLVEHYLALKKAKVSAELHIYAKVPHGFGMRESKNPKPVDSWMQRFVEFLAVEGFLK